MIYIKTTGWLIAATMISILPFSSKAQDTDQDLKNYFESILLAPQVLVDSSFISKVNNDKKISAEEKTKIVAEHKAEVELFNANLKEAINYWTGEEKLIPVDSTNAAYQEYLSKLSQAKENAIKGITRYYLAYSSTPLMGSHDRIFGVTHRPQMVLVESDLETGKGKVTDIVFVAQGVPSVGLLGCYYNTLNAQRTDRKNGVSPKDEKVFIERMEELKHKTLLIPAEFVSEKLTEELIAQLYPYKFEILDKNALNEKLQEEERDQYVVYQIVPLVATTAGNTQPDSFLKITKTAIMFDSVIFDVHSGRRMDIMKMKMTLAGTAGTNELTKKDLKKILEQIEQ